MAAWPPRRRTFPWGVAGPPAACRSIARRSRKGGEIQSPAMIKCAPSPVTRAVKPPGHRVSLTCCIQLRHVSPQRVPRGSSSRPDNPTPSSQNSKSTLVKSVKSDLDRQNRRKPVLVVRRVIDGKGFHTKTEADIRSQHVALAMREMHKDVEDVSLRAKPPMVCERPPRATSAWHSLTNSSARSLSRSSTTASRAFAPSSSTRRTCFYSSAQSSTSTVMR